MKPKTFMLIAGEASGDVLGAELVKALRTALPEAEGAHTSDQQPLRTSLAPRFFGAGGARMAEAGVEVVLDLTAHSVVGVSDVLKQYLKFKGFFNQLLQLAVARKPDVIICIDYSGFNLRFAQAIRKQVESLQGTFNNWDPSIVQYVSPQVWASRPGRVAKIEKAINLVLSIFPFEQNWYAARAPKLHVEFVGHPLVERYADRPKSKAELSPVPLVVLLPGSRPAELERHLPVLAQALREIAKSRSVRHVVVLPNERLHTAAKAFLAQFPELKLQVGGLAATLSEADLAMASTGTVTMECAWFGVPTVALYKASWSNYQIGKRIIKVRYLSMPNLLANEAVFPEFIQDQATPANLARAAVGLLSEKSHRQEIKAKLAQIIESLGPPGASVRAARAIAKLLCERRSYDIKGKLS